jgi:hypothetical protein
MKLWSSAGGVVVAGAGVGACGSVVAFDELLPLGAETDAPAGTVTEAERVGAVTSWARHADAASDTEKRAVARASIRWLSEVGILAITGAVAVRSPYGKR